MNRLKQAMELTQQGLNVLPIQANGSKEPALQSWKLFQKDFASEKELFNWFDEFSSFGIGIIAGSVSGNLEVLDIEADHPTDLVDLFVQRLGATRGKELVEKLSLKVKTPSGGAHFYYRCDKIGGSKNLAKRKLENGKLKILMETRGEGSYVISPYSPPECHKLNKPYSLVNGDFKNVPIITPEERDVILDVARSFNEYIKEPPLSTNISSTIYLKKPGDRPGDHFNEQAIWEDILIPKGWTKTKTQSNYTRWRRPDGTKDSASTYHASGLLYVFSCNARPFEMDSFYDKFAAYVLLNHNGNFSHAARTLADKGYGKNNREQAAISDSTPTNGNQTEADWNLPETFGEPLLFGEIETPDIKTDFLPSWVKDYVDAVATHIQAPAAAVAMLALSVLAACLQKRFEVCPYGDGSYSEPLSIWTLVALPPASRKTGFLKALRDAVIQWETEEAKRLQPEIIEQETERTIITKRIEELMKDAARAKE